MKMTFHKNQVLNITGGVTLGLTLGVGLLLSPLAAEPVFAQDAPQVEPEKENPIANLTQEQIAALIENSIKAERMRQELTINKYIGYLHKESNLDEAKRNEILELIKKYRADDKTRKDTLFNAMRKIYPEFDNGVDAYDDFEIDDAITSFKKMVKSNDKTLGLEARIMLARIYTSEGLFEAALPHLREVCKPENLDLTLHADEATFMYGVALSETLKYKDALTVLEDFLRKYQFTAPERMVVGAYVMADKLTNMEAGSLEDVYRHMVWSKGKLDKAETGEPTQEKHQKIVAMLDKLIEEAEENENKGQGQGQGQGNGQGQQQGNSQQQGNGSQAQGENPSSPAEESSAPSGDGKIKSLSREITGDSSETWAKTRAKERERVISAIKDKTPERWRQLNEEYFKSLRKKQLRNSDESDD